MRTSILKIDDLKPNFREALKTVINPSEPVIICVEVLSTGLLSSLTIWMVTNSNIIKAFGGKSFNEPTIDVISIDKITKVEVLDDIWGSKWVSVVGHDNARLDFQTEQKEISNKFYKAVQEARQQKSQNNPPSLSASSRLKQLEELLQEGLINESEYRDKRGDVLRKL